MFFVGVLVGIGGLLLLSFIVVKTRENKELQTLETETALADETKNENKGENAND